MSFQAKTDFFGLGASVAGIVLTDSTLNESASVAEAADDRGDIIAKEVYGATAAPSCDFVFKAKQTLNIILGKVNTLTGPFAGKYCVTGYSVATSMGTEPKLTVSGQRLYDTATDSTTITPGTIDVSVYHKAQIFLGAFALTGSGCHLQENTLNVQATLTDASKDGDMVAHDIHDGRITQSLKIVQTGSTIPTVTPANGFIITSPLTRTEADSDYFSWTCELTKYLESVEHPVVLTPP